MAITTYALLKAAVADWLNRDDLTTQIAQFIELYEERADDLVRSRLGLARTTLTLTGQFTALPTDFAEVESAWVTSPYKRLIVMDSKQLAEERQRTADAAGTLKWIAVAGAEMEGFPTPAANTDIELLYFRTVTPLAAEGSSNWLLLAHPDLYLYGSLIASAPFLHDDERINLWTGMHDRRLAEINIASERTKHGGSAPRIRHRAIG
jgi:hypothetical protein